MRCINRDMADSDPEVAAVPEHEIGLHGPEPAFRNR